MIPLFGFNKFWSDRTTVIVVRQTNLFRFRSQRTHPLLSPHNLGTSYLALNEPFYALPYLV